MLVDPIGKSIVRARAMDARQRVMWVRYHPGHDVKRLPWPSLLPLTLQKYADVPDISKVTDTFTACLCWPGQGSASDGAQRSVEVAVSNTHLAQRATWRCSRCTSSFSICSPPSTMFSVTSVL